MELFDSLKGIFRGTSSTFFLQRADWMAIVKGVMKLSASEFALLQALKIRPLN